MNSIALNTKWYNQDPSGSKGNDEPDFHSTWMIRVHAKLVTQGHDTETDPLF